MQKNQADETTIQNALSVTLYCSDSEVCQYTGSGSGEPLNTGPFVNISSLVQKLAYTKKLISRHFGAWKGNPPSGIVRVKPKFDQS